MLDVNLLSIFFYSFIVGVSTVAIGSINKIKRNDIRRVAYIFLSLFLALIAGYRDTTGTDSLMYKNLYLYKNVTRWVDIESGYMWLNDFFSKYISYKLFWTLLSFIILILILLSIDEYRKDINMYLSGLILSSTIYLTSFNILRQSLAVSICMFAIVKFVKDKKVIIPLTLIFIASLVHYSALLCLLLFLAKFIEDAKYKKLYLVILLSILVFLVFDRTLFGEIVRWITKSSYYEGYIVRQQSTISSIVKYFLQFAIIYIIAIYNFSNYRYAHGMMSLFVLMLWGYTMTAIGAGVETQVGRIGLYFSSFEIIVMPFCAQHNIQLSSNIVLDKDILRIILFLFYILSFIYRIAIRNYGELIPYQPFV